MENFVCILHGIYQCFGQFGRRQFNSVLTEQRMPSLARHLLYKVCPYVRLSVCHTGDARLNGSSYQNMLCIML